MAGEIQGGNSGFSGGPNNSPLNPGSFDETIKASQEAAKKQIENASKTGEKTQEVNERSRKSYQKLYANARESSQDFYDHTFENIEKLSKKQEQLADTSSKMFGLHAKAAQQVNQTIIGMGKNTEKALSVSMAASDVTMKELFASWTTRVMGAQKLVQSLHDKSHELSKSRKQGEDFKDHPFLKNIEHLQKMQAFEPEDIMGQISARASANVIQGGLGEMVGLLGKIAPALIEIMPAVAAFAGVGAMLSAIFAEMWKIDAIRAKWANEVGGDIQLTSAFTDRMLALGIATGKGQNAMIDLAEAFQDAGIEVLKADKRTDDYLVTAENMNKVFGLSNEQLSMLVKTQMSAGGTAADMMKTYSSLYDDMQRGNITIKEFQTALAEGNQIFKDFGSISGSAMSQVQDDVIKTAGLYKAFNIDVKNVQGSLDQLGDPKKQRKAAITTASILGTSAEDELALQYIDPAEAQKHNIEAQAKALFSNPYSQFGKSRDDLKGLGHAQINQIGLSRKLQLEQFSKAYNVPESQLNQLALKYQDFEHGSDKDKSVDNFLKVNLDSLKKEPEGSLQDAIKTQNKSLQAIADSAGTSLYAVVQHIAGNLDLLTTKVVGHKWLTPEQEKMVADVKAKMAQDAASDAANKKAIDSGQYHKDFENRGTTAQVQKLFSTPDSVLNSKMAAAAPTIATGLKSAGNALADASLEQASDAVAHGVKNRCAQYVEQAFDKVGLTGLKTPAAKDLVPLLSHDKRFRELGPDDIAMRGDIDVYTPGKGKSQGQRMYGHTEINQGDGTFTSDYRGKGGGAGKEGYGSVHHFRLMDSSIIAGKPVGKMNGKAKGLDLVPAPPPGGGLVDMLPPSEVAILKANQAAYQPPALPANILKEQAHVVAAQQLAAQNKTNELLAKANEHHEDTKQAVKQSADHQRKIAMAPNSGTIRAAAAAHL